MSLDINSPCPKCSSNVSFGYGLAGGGMGPYLFCLNDNCDFFQKDQDREIDMPIEPSRKRRIQCWQDDGLFEEVRPETSFGDVSKFLILEDDAAWESYKWLLMKLFEAKKRIHDQIRKPTAEEIAEFEAEVVTKRQESKKALQEEIVRLSIALTKSLDEDKKICLEAILDLVVVNDWGSWNYYVTLSDVILEETGRAELPEQTTKIFKDLQNDPIIGLAIQDVLQRLGS